MAEQAAAVRILIAPDKFKDALDAAGVAAALAVGVHAALPTVDVVCCPLADGGEGTARLLAQVANAGEHAADVLDPLGRPRIARWWLDGSRRGGIVELAEASGLCLLRAAERDAARTTTYGTGQLLTAAIGAGCERVTLCVGGSATVDGGAGCLQALGWQLRDAAGRTLPVPACGGLLAAVAELKPPPNPGRASVAVLCDVDNPLLGPRGAAEAFAPQKGATPTQVQVLERGLENWARVLERATGCDVRDLPGAGAAGGLPAGLAAALGARLVSGFDEVARRLDLPGRMRGCDLCLTGEGRLDEQTVGGKVVAGVARIAADVGAPAVALVGAVRLAAGQSMADLAARLGLRDIVVVTPAGAALPDALAHTARNLRQAASEYLVMGGRANLP